MELKLVYRKGGAVVHIELKGEKEEVDYFLEKLLTLVESQSEGEVSIVEKVEGESAEEGFKELPSIKIERGDTTSSIIKKIFSTDWGRKPRELKEVVEVLQTLGHYTNKTTVAVTLKRLVERGDLRRIRGSDKVYRYVAAYPSQGD